MPPVTKNLHRILFTTALVAVVCLIGSNSAFALDEIYSPNVEYRELSLEYNGSRTFDTHPDKNNAQEHEIALEARLTPRWEVEVSTGFAKDPGSSAQLEDIEIENRFQFWESGKYWLDAGALVAYDFATQSEQPNSLETKLLLQKDIGRFTSTANIGFTQNIGQYSGGAGGADYVFLWNTRYRYSQYFQPGIEVQSDLGQGHELGHYNEQEHYVGPAVYGRLYGHLKYQVAYLVGASTAAAQSAGRVLFEYEMHF